MVRIVSVVTAVMVFVAFSPVYGQESVPSATSPASVSSNPVVEGDKKGEQYGMENEREGRGKERKGKGRGRGQGHERKRGLDRADEVAGEHGKHGRDRARGHGKNRDREKQQDKDKHDGGEQHERD